MALSQKWFTSNKVIPLPLRAKSSLLVSSSLRSFIVPRTNPGRITTEIYTEYPCIQRSKFLDDGITTLIKLQAPSPIGYHPPLDLVAILDIAVGSGNSLAEAKLKHFKRAMRFIIRRLRARDRLSIVAFPQSAAAECVLPLCSMGDESNRVEAMKAVDRLRVTSTSANIVDGLSEAAEILRRRDEKNAVEAILLVSGGELGKGETISKHNLKVAAAYNGVKVPPVHVFGVGRDHDPISLNAISETSRGTYSFVESEQGIQDALAQCLGGLTTVVALDLQIDIQCVHQAQFVDIYYSHILSGGYPWSISDGYRKGSIHVGEMYGGERRDFLVGINFPKELAHNSTTHLIDVKTTYRQPSSGKTVTAALQLKLPSPEVLKTHFQQRDTHVLLQKKRLGAVEEMAAAMEAAEEGDFPRALNILRKCRLWLLDDKRTWDIQLLERMALEIEEMKHRMWDEDIYVKNGKAFGFALLSSHRLQRATAWSSWNEAEHGDRAIAPNSYRTAAMDKMLRKSRKEMRK